MTAPRVSRRAARRLAALGAAVALLALLALLAGCGATLEVGIERTPTPDRSLFATVEVLQQETARLSAALSTATAPREFTAGELGRVAFIEGGDLWVMALPEGPNQRLTVDGYNRRPAWSASGEWLAFRKDRMAIVQRAVPCREVLVPGQRACSESVSELQEQVWVMRRNGQSARPLNDGLSVTAFEWSPRGDRLAYVAATGELRITNAEGDYRETIAPAQPDGTTAAPAWSSDGEWIAYEVRVAENGYAGIWQRAWGQGGQQLELESNSRDPDADLRLAGWAGNDRVLFWRAADRTSMAAGAQLYALPAGRAARSADGARRPAATTLSAGKMLPYRDNLARHRADGTLGLIEGGGLPTWLNKRASVDEDVWRSPGEMAALYPAWSSGAALAFSAMPEAQELALGEEALVVLMQRRIWTADISDATSLRPLTRDANYRDEHPEWSTKDERILFARIGTTGQASLWLIDLAGGQPVRVVEELTPAPDPLGVYGFIDWHEHYDWWRPPP